MSQEVPADFEVFNATLSLDDPLKDYENLIGTKIKVDFDISNCFNEIWDKISEAVCDCIRKLLFDTKNPTKDQMDKASALLKEFKERSGFHSPMFYNRWIYEFRDELLKREQIDFWKNEVVAKELGPCFARDSDLHDHYDDPEPVNFYKHAGCEAPWLNEESEPPLNPICTSSSVNPKNVKKLTKKNALEDYKQNMLAQKNIDPDDKQAYEKIFTEVREQLWQLLFSEISSDETSEMAAELLCAYRLDACFFSPHDFYDLFTEVRDELFKRGYWGAWIIIQDKVPKDEAPADFAVFDATLSLDDPLKDYENLIDTKMYYHGETTEYFGEIWDKMSEAVCDCIRKLLFDTKNPTKDQMDKASALLKEFKERSGFHSPMFYNRWIYEFRDELLKREQIDFWKNEVVAKELGPCFARDSDLYDDYDDPEPLNFYKHAGCEAPWLNEESATPLNLKCTTPDNS